MTINTKFNLNDKCFFLMGNGIHQANVKEIEASNRGGETNVAYVIDKNPYGSQYTLRFNENDLFKTKEDLLKSL